MKKIRVGINGFGRIGRCILRSNLENNLIDIVGINDISAIDCSAHLIKYDSSYGVIPQEVKVTAPDIIEIDGQKLFCFTERDPAVIPWDKAQVDIVLECTGFFHDLEAASKHLHGGVKKVIVSAPGKDIKKTIVMGVNNDQYDPKNDHVISNASCTTNCLAPMAKVLDETFGIKKGLMTTIHSYTGDQRLLDAQHKDFRRARSAALSLVPTSTGAAKAIGEVLPKLNGKLNGISIRVPTPTVSLTDLVCEIEKNQVTKEEINQAFASAAQSNLKNILRYITEPLVSIDFKKDTHSCIIDGSETMVIGDNMIKVLAWYDNEWGYSTRMVELTKFLGDSL